VPVAAPDPLARAALDAAELLDVDVDELARPLALIAHSGLQAQPPELAQPDPRQDPRDRRQRPTEQLGDLRASAPDPAQSGDDRDRALVGAIGHRLRRRRAIDQARLVI